MTENEIKGKLSQLIDSEEKWTEIKREMLRHSFTVPPLKSNRPVYFDSNEVDPWWAQREETRFAYEVYENTTVTTELNKLQPGLFVHISKEDRNFVAYTVDGEAGKRDKQLKIAPGRFIRKYFPLFSDNYINQLVAQHTGEANAVLEYLTTYDEILEGYRENLDSSCMTVGKVWIDGLHPPAAVYSNLPNLKLAVLRSNGKVIARTLVRTDTKKYIRIYGNRRIATALKREGYTVGNLVGMELNAVPVKGKTGGFVMPYLDGNGGRGSTEVSNVARVGGKIYVVSRAQASKIRDKAYNAVGIATNTSGWVSLLDEVDESDFLFTDGITGKTYNLLTENRQVYKVYVEGEIRTTLEDPEQYGYVSARIYHENSWVFAKESDCFEYRGTRYIETPEQRKRLGYVKLDATLYPDEQDWFMGATVTDETGAVIKKSDGVQVIYLTGGECDSKYAHKSKITKKYTKVHSISRGEPVYAEPGVEVVKTVHGRKVVVGFHNVTFFEDLGAWDFSNKLKSEVTYGGKKYYFSTREVPERFHKFGEVHMKALEMEARERFALQKTDEAIAKLVVNAAYTYLSIYTVGSIRISPYSGVTGAQFNALKKALADGDLSEDHTKVLTMLMREYSEASIRLAEANAVEYPNKLEEFSEDMLAA